MVSGGLIKLAVVLQHLYAILIFVLLNMFVTLHICGDMYVNVAHFLFKIKINKWIISFNPHL